jgi:nitronate monooxygenase
MAPMGSVSPTSLAIAVANAGGLGGCGAVLMQPEAIRAWASDMRAGSNGGFQLNLWIPDPTPKRNLAAERAVRDFLRNWGPEVACEAGNFTLPDFAAQCEALLEAAPPILIVNHGVIRITSGANESEGHQVVCNSNDRH